MSEYRLLHGDALAVLKTLPSESVHVCISSPPYFGLRSYLHNGHEHKSLEVGTEDTPDAYVARLVEVFREVRRVLHKTGTVWLNLGSSYSGSGGAGGDYNEGGLREGQPRYAGRSLANFKPKDMIFIPAMVAMALQQDGWWLRADIIWHKRAPMPASVRDRPTPAHEYVFLLSKSADYFYDATAIAEPAVGNTPANVTHKHQNGDGIILGRKTDPNSGLMNMGAAVTRNRRSVWTLGPEQFPGSHFATMPTKLVEPCILAGSSAHGCCSQCGAPWERVVERESKQEQAAWSGAGRQNGCMAGGGHFGRTGQWSSTVETTGWVATCLCGADVIPCTVLDPFSGAGTVGVVALKHHRHYIGIDLNESYNELARRRIEQVQPTLLEVT